MRHHRSNQRLFNIPSPQARLYGRETYALFTRGKDTPYVFDVLLGHRNVNNLRSRVFLFFFLSLSLSMWSQELDWNFDRERGTVKRRTVNYFIPVLGEEILHDIELERGKSIKRRNFARVRCQVTLAKRRVFFLRGKQRKRSLSRIRYSYTKKRREKEKGKFLNAPYIISYTKLWNKYTREVILERAVFLSTILFHIPFASYIFKKFSKGEGKLNGSLIEISFFFSFQIFG